MILKTISYSESKETVNEMGLKQWIKIGVEMELEDGDKEEFVFSCARERVKMWHKETNPSQYFEQITTQSAPIPEYNKEHERLEIAIDNATTIRELYAIAPNITALPNHLQIPYMKKQDQLREK